MRNNTNNKNNDKKGRNPKSKGNEGFVSLELIDLLLKRAGLKKEDIYNTAMKSWASKNLDLLTPAEMKKYHEIIA